MSARRRPGWGFASGGGGGGIWRSEDGGETWARLSGSGLPNGSIGRVALDIARSNPDVLYAQIETAPDREPVEPAPQGRGGRGGGGGGGGSGCPQGEILNGGGGRGQQQIEPDDQCSGVWRSSDKGRSWQCVSNHNMRRMSFSQSRSEPNDENTGYTGGVGA
jgi:hypothetical protein